MGTSRLSRFVRSWRHYDLEIVISFPRLVSLLTAPKFRWYSTVMGKKQGRVEWRQAVQKKSHSSTKCMVWLVLRASTPGGGGLASAVLAGLHNPVAAKNRTAHACVCYLRRTLPPLRYCGSWTSEGISGARTGNWEVELKQSSPQLLLLHALAAPSVHWVSGSK